VALVFAFAVGGVVLMAIGKNPIGVYVTMFSYSFSRLDSVGTILFRATPLMFSGLAVAISFRVGLFNIGVEGQYFVGAFAAALAGFALTGLPAFIHLPLTIAAGIAGGMFWALVPIWLKLKRGAHEVITTIMMNHISYALVHFFVATVFFDRNQNIVKGYGSPQMRMPKIAGTALMPELHGLLDVFSIELPKHVYLNWFFPLGVLVAVGVYLLVWRTPFGYELRAVGSNPTAAETAGIPVGATAFKAFLISGGLAGMVGLSDLLGYFGYLDIDFPVGLGFTGIAVALLARNNALGIVATALLFGFLRRGAEGIQAFEGVPMDTVDILEGVIILSVVIAVSAVNMYLRHQEKVAQRRQASQPLQNGVEA